jgi:protein-disulfide isomerase
MASPFEPNIVGGLFVVASGLISPEAYVIARNTRNALVIAAASLILLNGWPALASAAQPSETEIGALREEVKQLRGEIEAMRSELHTIMQRLGASPAPHRVTVTTAGGIALGNANASIALVEFSDYQCPFCKRFHDQSFAELKKDYVDSGKLRYVFRDFPLDRIHPQARKAAEAAHCMGAQGEYWQAHDTLFKNQDHLQMADLKSYAAKAGLDMKAFDECLDKETYAKQVQENLDDGIKAGVRGTPTFVLGRLDKNGTVDGLLITGARPLEDFRQAIDQLLADKNK